MRRCSRCGEYFEPTGKEYCCKECTRIKSLACYRGEKPPLTQYQIDRDAAKKPPRYNHYLYSIWRHIARASPAITFEQVVEFQKTFTGCCDICGKPTRNKVLEHDSTRQVLRGWLCLNCNVGLNRLKKNPELLTRALEYLRGQSVPS